MICRFNHPYRRDVYRRRIRRVCTWLWQNSAIMALYAGLVWLLYVQVQLLMGYRLFTGWTGV